MSTMTAGHRPGPASLASPSPGSPSLPSADPERRATAFAVDRLIGWGVAAGVAYAAWRLADLGVPSAITVFAGTVVVLGLIAAVVLGTTGLSPAKAMLGLRVVRRSDGRPVGVLPALGRTVVLGLAGLPTLGLGAATLGWSAAMDPTGKRRALHDRIGDAVVVDTRPPSMIEPVAAEAPQPVVNLTALRLLPDPEPAVQADPEPDFGLPPHIAAPPASLGQSLPHSLAQAPVVSHSVPAQITAPPSPASPALQAPQAVPPDQQPTQPPGRDEPAARPPQQPRPAAQAPPQAQAGPQPAQQPTPQQAPQPAQQPRSGADVGAPAQVPAPRREPYQQPRPPAKQQAQPPAAAAPPAAATPPAVAPRAPAPQAATPPPARPTPAQQPQVPTSGRHPTTVPAAPVVQPPAQAPAQPDAARVGVRWRVSFDTGHSFVVEGLALIGRRPEPRPGEPVLHVVPLPSEDMSLSKTHAQFQVAPDGALVVMDRGSTNGSYLARGGASKQLSPGRPATLVDGDQVRFGDRTMRVERLT